MPTRRYRLINNLLGWTVFAIALATYWLTLEPTASYWDCGEFITQGYKLEVGHPPGNPIFMLAARFFVNFAPDVQSVPLMVNAMSGLLSALTIMLLFWTVTHMTRRLVVRDGQTGEPGARQYLAIMGAGLVGALAYCWSDTFWFSAVEGEVYAFSSFCTALVFWLILKWEDHADEPHSDRWLVLIAYVIGVSIAVHLLNLLCIPAIVLVFAYRKWRDMDITRSLLALGVSFVIVALVLFGLVPGFIKMAQQCELLFVNTFGLGFNSGALCYTLLTAALFVWTLAELYRGGSPARMRLSFFLSVAASGMLFIGSAWWPGLVLLAGLAAALWGLWRGDRLPVRVLNVVAWSIAVIFVGYSSYALILIRSTAETPMNQNSPDNVFDLAAYLNREQYGENPLLYGETLNSGQMKELAGYESYPVEVGQGQSVDLQHPVYNSIVKPGKAQYAKGVAGAEPRSEHGFLDEADKERNAALARRGGDYYVKRDHKPEVKLNPELDMFFPRIYSAQHRSMYGTWVNLDTMPGNLVTVSAVDALTGERVPELDVAAQPYYNEVTGKLMYPEKQVYKPTYAQNLSYFLNYQLNHMYLRYFMWNFAGRQNDINNQFGELDAGNWISGIPAIDNARLGDQSLLPAPLGEENAGHNVYYMLPLLLGLAGLLWQAFAGRRGIEQFWVVFFLFFMTGIAIVLYLNQPPNQPRERDYAFAGSFYAFAIWIGMGVPALWRLMMWMWRRRAEKKAAAAEAGSEETAVESDAYAEPEQSPAMTGEPERLHRASAVCAAVALALGLAVPLQMVSQTWDDHDRSGRYAARDFGINYLESLEPNAIIFCNGDNDTFPLWYAQEVEGVRPDVKIINLSYLNSDWYADQMRLPSYTAPGIEFTARPADYAYGRLDVTLPGESSAPADMLAALRALYAGESAQPGYPYPVLRSGVLRIPVDKETVRRRGLVPEGDEERVEDFIQVDLTQTAAYRQKRYLSMGEILMLDIIATNAANGWKRPIYWASTVGEEYQLGLTPYLRSTGMAQQLVPVAAQGVPARADRAYDVVTKRYRWGGADVAEGKKAPYFDETAGRMLTAMRSSMLDVTSELVYLGDAADKRGDTAAARSYYTRALEVCRKLERNLPARTQPYGLSVGLTLAESYGELSQRLSDPKLAAESRRQLEGLMRRYAPYVRYNTMAAARFASPSLTIESRYAPYQFYRFVELYLKYGGKQADAERIVKPYGVNLAEMKRMYDSLYGDRTAADTATATTAADLAGYAVEIAKYAEVANELSGLDAAEYARRSEEEKTIDSMLWQMVDYYVRQGGSEEELRKYPEYRKLDMNRVHRLNDEFLKAHPELVEQ